MGHWSEELVDDVARMVGGNPDRRMLAEIAAAAGHELELLSGRTFQGRRRTTSAFAPNGLPFVDVPDIRVGSVSSTLGVWEIPNPVDRDHATLMQLVRLETPVRRAAPVGKALGIGGQLVCSAFAAGALSADYVLEWFATHFEPGEIQELLRQLTDPSFRFHVPVFGIAIEGWWFQVARRVLWVTNQTEDEGRLLELVLTGKTSDGKAIPLAATEPILIVARMTQHPVDWAFTARIWPEGAHRPADRRWSVLAKAVHGHGVPTITVDAKSTPQEIACQVILKGYWHGYIEGDEPAIASAVEAAYPQPVERIRRQTRAPTAVSAAARLLEQLIHPGFDPAQGAEATRRYVRNKANIVVMEYRKLENPDRYPWTQVGISERRFYKLLPLFASKINSRYDYDQDDVVARMRMYLDAQDGNRAVRAAALEVLRSHGFQDSAARKWLQRHPAEDAVDAWPRGSRGIDKQQRNARVRHRPVQRSGLRGSAG